MSLWASWASARYAGEGRGRRAPGWGVRRLYVYVYGAGVGGGARRSDGGHGCLVGARCVHCGGSGEPGAFPRPGPDYGRRLVGRRLGGGFISRIISGLISGDPGRRRGGGSAGGRVSGETAEAVAVVELAHLGGEVGVPPFVVAGGAGPEGAEGPAGRLALADGASHAAQMPGDGEGGQGGADGLLPVEGELLGEHLDAHGRAVGEVVDESRDVPLTRRQ